MRLSSTRKFANSTEQKSNKAAWDYEQQFLCHTKSDRNQLKSNNLVFGRRGKKEEIVKSFTLFSPD